MAKYTLTYFNTRGSAEAIRFVFAQAGVTYEDKRLEKEEWAQMKPNHPTGTLPMLEVDGVKLTGSWPILRFVAERFGLAGKNDLENAELAGMYDVFTDLLQHIFFGLFHEADEAIKEKNKKKIEEEQIPKYFGILEKKATENGWMYGNGPTYMDFAMYNMVSFMPMMFPSFNLDSYPKIKKVQESVGGLPKIAEWIEKRPKTDH